MNMKTIIAGVIGVLVIAGGVSVLNHGTASTPPAAAAAAPVVSNAAPVSASSTVPLMQSTGALFSQYQNASKAHEIFPTPSADIVQTMGAFGYTKESLGNNIYRITLTNSAEGYVGQSVVVSGDQSVYFVELSARDDTASEDSFTKDDFLMAVDAQGNILK